MKIAVTVPVYVRNQMHWDFLCRTIQSITSTQHSLVFIPVENKIEIVFAHQNYPDLKPTIEKHPISARHPQGVARAWNSGIEEAIRLGCDYVLIINQDIVLRSDAIDNLVAFAQTTPDDIVLWSMGQHNGIADLEMVPLGETCHEHPNFSSFLIRKDFFDVMGRFDENFYPAYYEDNDMHARIALSNKKAIVYGGALFFHFASRTTTVDSEIAAEVGSRFAANGRYFVEKWGRQPCNEVVEMREKYYSAPYNEQDKPLSFWHPC